MIHLPNYSNPGTNLDFPDALCGARDVKTMSAHELKRGRISCPDCLRIYNSRKARHDRLPKISSKPGADFLR